MGGLSDVCFTNDGGLIAHALQLFAGWAHSHPPLFVFPHPPSPLIMLILLLVGRILIYNPCVWVVYHHTRT